MTNCEGCKWEHESITDDVDHCEGCTALTYSGRSCHINPPCSFCVGYLYEEKR